MKAASTTLALSRSDYLEQSLLWEHKHEWINGQVYGMSGGSTRHCAITANLLVALAVALRGSPCRTTTSDQRVFVPASEASLYPDLSVVCGAFLKAEDDDQAIVNPSLVVEVLSPSTRNYDLGAKLGHYLLIETMQHVLFVETESTHCILYSRSPEGWLRRDLHEGRLPLEGLGISLPVEAIYRDLEQV